MRIRFPALGEWKGLGIAAGFGLLAFGSVAAAQDQSSPLRFLKPWIEEQLDAPTQAPGAGPSEDAGAGESTPPIGDTGAAAMESTVLPEAVAPPESAPGSGRAREAAVQPEQPGTPNGPTAPEGIQPVEPAEEAQGAPRSEGAEPEPPDDGEEASPLPESPGVARPAPQPATKQRPQPIRLGVLAGRDVRATMAAVQPVAEALTRSVGRGVEILPLSSYAAMIDAQGQRRIDGGFYSASAFALSQANCRCLEPIVAPAAADGTVAYYGIIVAGPQSGIASVADLQGRTVAVGADDSIGTRRMQLAGLVAEGVDPGRFGNVREVESADAAVRLVLAGEADAAFAWSSMEGDLQSGYSRGTLSNLVAQGELDMSQLAVIWRSPAITHGPFALLTTLDEEVKRQIEVYLAGLERAEPAAYDMLNPYYSGGYVAVEPEDFSGLELLASQDIDEIALPVTPPQSSEAMTD